MTAQELAEAIEGNTAVQQEIAENLYLRMFNRDNMATLLRLSITAQRYLLNYRSDGSVLPVFHYNLDNTTRSHTAKIYVAGDIKQYLQLDTLIILEGTAVANKERNRRATTIFNTNAKSLELNEFNFELFRAHLQSSKPLTGKDSLRYIDLLPSFTDVNQATIRMKYLNLIWNNAKTKSLALGTRLDSCIYNILYKYPENTVYTPFMTIRGKLESSLHGYSTAVSFTYDAVVAIARAHTIPMSIQNYYVSNSELHQYITGVPKKNPMSQYDIIYAIDKLKVFMAMNIHTNNKIPYYQMAIDQLKAELARADNREQLQKVRATTISSGAALEETNNFINNLLKEAT